MKRKNKDYLIGLRFGKLIILSAEHKRDNSGYIRCMLQWKCDCGKVGESAAYQITGGKTRSCSCYRIQRTKESNTKHGQSYNPIYQVWAGMWGRCNNPNDKFYHNYGGRGINICDEWKESKVFFSWALKNGYVHGLELDRKNNDGDYCPDNCRFVTVKQNQRNKRNNRFIEFRGESKTVAEWCELMNMKYYVVLRRLNRGWSADLALTKSEKYVLKKADRISLGLKARYTHRRVSKKSKMK